MGDFQVLCVGRSQRPLPHECIAKIGGMNSDGTRWSLTQAEAIDGIDVGRWRFYVSVGGRAAAVIVGTSVMGHNYLTTCDDADQPLTLLNLLDCPA